MRHASTGRADPATSHQNARSCRDRLIHHFMPRKSSWWYFWCNRAASMFNNLRNISALRC